MGQTVNLLSFDFGGSNPSLPTKDEKHTLLVFCIYIKSYTATNHPVNNLNYPKSHMLP